MQRRGFLASILAAGVAPAFVGSKILMPVRALALPSLDMGEIQRRALEYEAPRYGESYLRTSADMRLGQRFTIAGIGRSFVVTEIMGGGIISVAAM